AEQYLPAAGSVVDPTERRRVAELFQAAAAAVRRTTNYAAMQRYLAAARALVDGASDVDSTMLAGLETGLHAALYSLGRLEEADALYRSIERRRPDPVELVEAACVQISSLGHRGRYGE